MNLRALNAQAVELDRGIAQLMELHATGGAYHELLERFSVVHFQYAQLQDQLRSALKHWVVHPRSVDEALARGMSNGLLSPKLSPEVERGEQELLRKAKEEGAEYEQLLARVEHVNKVVDFLTATTAGADGRGVLGPGSQARKAILAVERGLGTKAQVRVQEQGQSDPEAQAFLASLASFHP